MHCLVKRSNKEIMTKLTKTHAIGVNKKVIKHGIVLMNRRRDQEDLDDRKTNELFHVKNE